MLAEAALRRSLGRARRCENHKVGKWRAGPRTGSSISTPCHPFRMRSPDCKFACNTPPEGRFSRQFRPPLTLCVSVLPLALIGPERADRAGWGGQDTGRYGAPISSKTARFKEIVRHAFGVARDVRKVIRSHKTEFKIRAWVQPTPSLATGSRF